MATVVDDRLRPSLVAGKHHKTPILNVLATGAWIWRWFSSQLCQKWRRRNFFPFQCKLAEGPRDEAPRDKEWATWPRRNNAGEASRVLFY
ncbi:hypothetical protein PVK06_034928 [Gossypium arboreum]|uniref:Uncharacterized protein n=1 Tax=Gossypium arboreum TaxID=29729 RepID=A0ABR0NFJ4_GOSAR|nr:hypothetical protein PVK06_034928 [Gossypium arboreum]